MLYLRSDHEKRVHEKRIHGTERKGINRAESALFKERPRESKLVQLFCLCVIGDMGCDSSKGPTPAIGRSGAGPPRRGRPGSLNSSAAVHQRCRSAEVALDTGARFPS